MGPGCVTYPGICLRSGFYPARTLVKPADVAADRHWTASSWTDRQHGGRRSVIGDRRGFEGGLRKADGSAAGVLCGIEIAPTRGE